MMYMDTYSKDLMLGDWVYNEITKSYDQVSSITDPDIETIHCQGGTTCWKPIPLTPEIMDKNGFKRDVTRGEDIVWNISVRVIQIGYHEMFNFCLKIEGKVIHQMPMDYVHEFQQVLRFMGMNKLADNLKI